MLPFIFFSFLLMLSGCSPNSLDDYQREGQVFCKNLSRELAMIHSREDLLKAESKLKKKFDDLVQLIMEARTYQVKHPDEFPNSQEEQNPFSEELLFELKRIYGSIEGGREIIERSQKEALFRLDGFEKKLQKKFIY